MDPIEAYAAVAEAGSQSEFELVGWIREGKVMECQSGTEDGIELEIVFCDGLIVHVTGYELMKMAEARKRAEAFVAALPGHIAKQTKVEMPTEEMEKNLQKIHRVAARFGYKLDLKHGYDGHSDAVGISFGSGERLYCLRFNENHFEIHGWGDMGGGSPNYERAKSLAIEISGATGFPVAVKVDD